MSTDPISLHKKLKGKIFVCSKLRSLSTKNIGIIYTPGVAQVSKAIFHHPDQKFLLTSKGNNIAIISDGTRVLGLGNIGPDASLPVMEGKSVLYRQYGKISAYPICLATADKKKIIETIHTIEPVFGAINLEDIESPKVLEIAEELENSLKIPVFHDDGQGTSIVALAALLNSLKLTNKKISEIKTVIAGAGSAGYWIARLFSYAGCKNIVVLDSHGAIYKGRKNLNKYKRIISKISNPKERGSLLESLVDADVFVGVSGVKNLLKPTMIVKMNTNPIILALTNPYPEITPTLARKGGAKIVATGSYKYKNQVNNALVFPYFMRAILDLRIQKISLKTLYDASTAIANTLTKKELTPVHILPKIDDKRIQKRMFKNLE